MSEPKIAASVSYTLGGSDADAAKYPNRHAMIYLRQELDACRAELARSHSKPRWIPVSERLPEWGQFVIVAYAVACGPPEREVGAECHYADGVWTGCDKMRGGQPTHWMPMPAPPAE